MHRIDTVNNVPGLPVADAPGTPGFFDKGDPAIPREATFLSQDWCNAVQEEIAGAVEASGQTLDKTNNNQLADGFAGLSRNKLFGFRPAAQDPVSLQVDVEPGTFFNQNTGLIVTTGTQVTPVFVAPIGDPRNDIVYINAETGVFGVAAGTEAPVPADPVIPFGNLPVGRVRLTVAMTEITAADLDDVRYLSALGVAVPPPASITMFHLGNFTANNVATYDLPGGIISPTFDNYELWINVFSVSLSGARPRLQVSTGGVLQTGSQYAYQAHSIDSTGAESPFNNNGTSIIDISHSGGLNDGEPDGWIGKISLHNVNATTRQRHMHFKGTYEETTGDKRVANGSASFVSIGTAIDGLRFLVSGAGQITVLDVDVYGIAGGA